MSVPDARRITRELLSRYGRTFGEELGIDLEANTPSSLFQLLCASLFSARIGHPIALSAARSLFNKGWKTPDKLARSKWKQRVAALDEAKYVRYDERTSTMLGETAQMLIDKYKGDLRNLRDDAGRIPERERKLLKEFKGIGEVGVDIFFREAQVAWTELFPFADRKALEGARSLGLPSDPTSLADLTPGRRRFARLVAALVRTRLERTQNEIRKQAAA